MALPKKGQRNQFVFPMIEADGLSVASTLTAASIAAKAWGYNHNTTTAPVSVPLSRAASLVKSGLFYIQTNPTENIYDRMNLIFTATGCVDQDLPIDFVDYDDSDMRSYMIALSAQISDIYSAVQAGGGGGVNVSGAVSDIQSFLLALSAQLSNFESRFDSRVGNVVGNMTDFKSAMNTVVSSPLSDIHSYLIALSNQVSNFQSQFTSRVTGVAMTRAEIKSAVGSVMSSPLSDIHSGVTAGRSVASDTYSLLTALSAQLSDVYSAVGAIATTSDLRSRLSDIQSYLQGLSANISDVYSAVGAVATTSDLRSRLSDIQSYLVGMSAMLSDTHSAATAGRSVASDVQSYLIALSAQLSDVYSAVQAGGGGSGSDLRSRLSDIQSYLMGLSAQLSDVHSGVTAGRAFDVAMSAQLSDVYSAVQAGAGTSDLRSRLSDMQSYLIALSGQLSNLHSTVDARYSDLASKIGGVSVALSPAQISDLASQVADAVGFSPAEIASAVSTVLEPGFAGLSGMLSDVYSATLAGGSGSGDTYSLLTALRPEPGQEAPPMLTDPLTKADYLYKAFRNQATQTSGKYRLYNNDALTVGQSAVVSDDGTTFTRGEIGNGA